MFKSTKMAIFVLLTLKIPVESTKTAIFVLSIWNKVWQISFKRILRLTAFAQDDRGRLILSNTLF